MKKQKMKKKARIVIFGGKSSIKTFASVHHLKRKGLVVVEVKDENFNCLPAEEIKAQLEALVQEYSISESWFDPNFYLENEPMLKQIANGKGISYNGIFDLQEDSIISRVKARIFHSYGNYLVLS